MQGRQPGMPGGGRQAFKPGDWYCGRCRGHNFERRQQCFRCGEPRGGGGGEGGGGGGGAPYGPYGHAQGYDRAPMRAQSAQDVRSYGGSAHADANANAHANANANASGNGNGNTYASGNAGAGDYGVGARAGSSAGAGAPPPPAAAAAPPLPAAPEPEAKYFYMDPQDAEANTYGPFTPAQYREWLGNLAPGGPQADDGEFCRFAKMLTWREGDPASQKVYLMQTLDLPEEVQNVILTGQKVPAFDMAPSGGRAEDSAAKLPPEPVDRVAELREAVSEVVRGVLQASQAWQEGKLSKQGFKDLCRRTVDKVMAEEQKRPEAIAADSIAALVEKRRQDISTLAKQMLGHHMQTSPR